MNFTLLPNLTGFVLGFVFLALAGAVTLATLATQSLLTNRAVRVRRHEGVVSYYGHLALGH